MINLSRPLPNHFNFLGKDCAILRTFHLPISSLLENVHVLQVAHLLLLLCISFLSSLSYNLIICPLGTMLTSPWGRYPSLPCSFVITLRWCLLANHSSSFDILHDQGNANKICFIVYKSPMCIKGYIS